VTCLTCLAATQQGNVRASIIADSKGVIGCSGGGDPRWRVGPGWTETGWDHTPRRVWLQLWEWYRMIVSLFGCLLAPNLGMSWSSSLCLVCSMAQGVSTHVSPYHHFHQNKHDDTNIASDQFVSSSTKTLEHKRYYKIIQQSNQLLNINKSVP
jgi:hypothetical protein